MAVTSYIHRRRHDHHKQQPWWRISFRGFALILLLMSLATLGPTFLLHYRLKQGLLRRCKWIRNPPLVCAHGGDSSSAPPNTFEAYNRALEIKSDCIEIDASRTGDGVLVALHDRELQNIYGTDHVHVGDLTINEIRKLDAGRNFPKEFHNQKIPSLDNAIQHVSRFLKQVIVDAKVGPPMFGSSLASDILKVLNVTGCKNCLVWSKHDSVVSDLKQLNPNVMAGYIVMKEHTVRKMTNPLRLETPEVVGAFHGAVNAKLVSDVHRVGKKVFVWTVNDRETMQKMLLEGVDGIITSYPRLLQELMQEIEDSCLEEGFVS